MQHTLHRFVHCLFLSVSLYVFALALLSAPPVERACVWVVDELIYMVVRVMIGIVQLVETVPLLYYVLPFLVIFAVTYHFAPGEVDETENKNTLQSKV